MLLIGARFRAPKMDIAPLRLSNPQSADLDEVEPIPLLPIIREKTGAAWPNRWSGPA